MPLSCQGAATQHRVMMDLAYFSPMLYKESRPSGSCTVFTSQDPGPGHAVPCGGCSTLEDRVFSPNRKRRFKVPKNPWKAELSSRWCSGLWCGSAVLPESRLRRITNFGSEPIFWWRLFGGMLQRFDLGYCRTVVLIPTGTIRCLRVGGSDGVQCRCRRKMTPEIGA